MPGDSAFSQRESERRRGGTEVPAGRGTSRPAPVSLQAGPSSSADQRAGCQNVREGGSGASASARGAGEGQRCGSGGGGGGAAVRGREPAGGSEPADVGRADSAGLG